MEFSRIPVQLFMRRAQGQRQVLFSTEMVMVFFLCAIRRRVVPYKERSQVSTFQALVMVLITVSRTHNHLPSLTRCSISWIFTMRGLSRHSAGILPLSLVNNCTMFTLTFFRGASSERGLCLWARGSVECELPPSRGWLPPVFF